MIYRQAGQLSKRDILANKLIYPQGYEKNYKAASNVEYLWSKGQCAFTRVVFASFNGKDSHGTRLCGTCYHRREPAMRNKGVITSTKRVFARVCCFR